MNRLILDRLAAWKGQERRKPLILRGARQVGKTWAVKELGERRFGGSLHVVDLEKRQNWHAIFEPDLSPRRILSELEVLLDARITPGEDLLFLDEIQSCPRAVMALRYFHEDIPELHVIAAGSLLEFALEDISFPVGRVQFMHLPPMCFAEFLMATGNEIAAGLILSPPRPLAASVHAMLLDELRRYLFVGGMPACVLAYSKNRRIRDAFEVQGELADSFRQDFSKYAPRADKRCLNAVLSAVATGVGQQVKYTRLAEGFTIPTIKKAFDLLALAQVIHRIPAASPPEVPLGASASEKKFKAIMVDVGLMQHLTGMPLDVEYARTDLLAIHEGAMAEQFVGQELVAAGTRQIHYWSREAKGSSAEVDYLVEVDGKVRPVEVKSGAAGRLRSLHLLLESHPGCDEGHVLSGRPLDHLPEQRLRFLPLYNAFSIGS